MSIIKSNNLYRLLQKNYILFSFCLVSREQFLIQTEFVYQIKKTSSMKIKKNTTITTIFVRPSVVVYTFCLKTQKALSAKIYKRYFNSKIKNKA